MFNLTKTDIKKVVKFWDWFKSVSNDLILNPTRNDLTIQIDNHISQLGHFDWEIGPWDENSFYFAISPNLDPNKLNLTHQIIEHAPKCKGWHFLASKPPKEWQGIWKMKNEKGTEIWINSNNWKYILYAFEDKTFDMDIMIDDINGNDDTINMAIDIALTGFIGEEKFMNLIKNISIISCDEEFSEKATSIKYIAKHIESILINTIS
ncbi:hypothetical protein HDF18_08700 [Mucilaginibacter sp. X5P1]|uniref:hypothetical protein n=1 Tax=Mucilaginibacter sp. X5P1 TaxID=2723088 RepID=UPI00160F3F24|nr:hypothetical protein [Mucilaginibacter sp. X5P1]MBB6137738.1 hypothetical protein [Mucilaginibacter sp. X5P1]